MSFNITIFKFYYLLIDRDRVNSLAVSIRMSLSSFLGSELTKQAYTSKQKSYVFTKIPFKTTVITTKTSGAKGI